MDYGVKRKFDCLTEIDVFSPQSSQQSYENFMIEQSKRVRLSIQLGSTGPSQSDCCSFNGSDTPTEAWSWQGRNPTLPDSDMDMEERCDNGNQEDMSEDIPTTSEVINSLRKVILWMSAQDDHNNDYIQYLTDVEHYALSKQPTIQQRKITQYFNRRD